MSSQLKKLSGVQPKMMAGALVGMKQAAMWIENYGIQHAPVDEGTLRGSFNSDVTENASGFHAIVSANTPYARKQHEGKDFKHPKGGEAYYLSNAAKASVAIAPKIIGQSIKKAVK